MPEVYISNLCGLGGDFHTFPGGDFCGSSSMWLSNAHRLTTGLGPLCLPDQAALHWPICGWLGAHGGPTGPALRTQSLGSTWRTMYTTSVPQGTCRRVCVPCWGATSRNASDMASLCRGQLVACGEEPQCCQVRVFLILTSPADPEDLPCL